MALKLGKCRLCLKLGDFFSIFTMDNAIQLSEMAMDCARIKIYEGDGLPDKICSECVQKLSSAYIFKQQCERADTELRRNYVPPPGFSITPPPNRQSSDSAFSSAHTDVSYNKQPSTEKVTPVKRNRKRSHESMDESNSSKSHDFQPTSSKRVEELKKTSKRARNQSPNASADSDYEDNSFSHFDTDSDDQPIVETHKCRICDRSFKSGYSLRSHMKWCMQRKQSLPEENTVVELPRKSMEDAKDSEDKLTCDKCQKTFKLKIMLKRHQATCGKNPEISKELLITLEPIDAVKPSTSPVKTPSDPNKIDCDYCSAKFKTYDNLAKHMRVCHAAVPKKPRESYEKKASKEETVHVPCLYCRTMFNEYEAMTAHFNNCPKADPNLPFQCPLCNKIMTKKYTYFSHIKQIHFHEYYALKVFECRMCHKRLASQDELIAHLGTHMPAGDESQEEIDDDFESTHSTADDNMSTTSDYTSSSVSIGKFKCNQCDKAFKYKKAWETHQIVKHDQVLADIKTEPEEKPTTSQTTPKTKTTPNKVYKESEDEDSSPGEGDDLTCDLCEKQFSYKRLLIQHKKTKHNMSSGHKRAKINLKDCMVRCLICDIEMKVSGINEHNQKHITANIKPRNQYTCGECGEQFKACSALANHIKIIHRLKQQLPPPPVQFEGADLADFCEVVVTKAEPLEDDQSHNGYSEVPLSTGPQVDMAGFTCHLCGKKLRTLISLKRHVNWHNNVGNNIQKNIECFVCKETFRFQCHYRLHMREHYTDPNLDPKLLTCAICGRRSKHLRAAQAHMNFHKQTRFQNKDYQCSICKRVFQFRKVYLSHMAIHYKRGEGQNAIVGDRPLMNAKPLDGSHTCPQCGKVCDSENSLKCHIRWHSSKTALFGQRHECNLCGLQFTNKRRLEIHTRDHFEDENGPYKCTICGKGYIDEEYFRKHVKGHNFDHQSHQKRLEKLRKDKVKCPICSRYYPDLVKLIRHLKRTHPECKMIKEDPDAPPPQYYSCKLCTKVFLTEERLMRHEESHKRRHQFFKCKFCGIKSVSLQKHRLHVKQRHLTQKHLDNPIKCPNCPETFVHGYKLHHHVRDVHGIDELWIADRTEEPTGPLKEFQCSICLKILASKGNFERHLDYHNSFRCNYCFDYFTSQKYLAGHLAFSCEKKKLLGDSELNLTKKVKCHICYKAFHLQVKLDCHLRTQHGILVTREASEEKRENLCDYCFKVFENEYALSVHKIYHRTIGYYGCIYCERKFNTLVLFNKHKTSHLYKMEPDNPTKCEHCDERFVLFKDMIDHMKEVHNDDKDWLVLPKESIEEECHLCKKRFYNLHRHMAYHEENRCKKCGEYFFSRIDFDNHLCSIESDDEVQEGNENDIRPKYEECYFCFKPLTKSCTQKLHDSLHIVSGAISCRFCTLKFKTLDAFNIHAFSHRSRKYDKHPIKCRICKEKFVRYGPFIKHMKIVHKSKKKVHYRAMVKPERCVVCGDMFPNLHNHYRSHLQNQCLQCRKYFTSSKLFTNHQCDKEDADPSKVFTSDEDLIALINSYVPKDEKDDEKYYGYTDDEEELEEEQQKEAPNHNDDSQNSINENIVQPFVISDVLSLYERKEELLAMYQDGKVTEDPKTKEINRNKKRVSEKTSPKKNGDSKPEDNDDDVEVVMILDDDSNGAENGIVTIELDD